MASDAMGNGPLQGGGDAAQAAPHKFGARDVADLSWKNLLDAYSCTECGRCTAACPANITGKKLSPRKIMMDTRDRAEAQFQSGSRGPTGRASTQSETDPNRFYSLVPLTRTP